MSIYLKETTSEEAGKIVKFLGWNQKDVWNAPLGDGSD